MQACRALRGLAEMSLLGQERTRLEHGPPPLTPGYSSHGIYHSDSTESVQFPLHP